MATQLEILDFLRERILYHKKVHDRMLYIWRRMSAIQGEYDKEEVLKLLKEYEER